MIRQHPTTSAAPTAETSGAPPLRLIFWETTAACNLQCVHCRRLDVSMQMSKDDLSPDQAMSMVRSLPQTGRPIVVFSGGEPLMRPDLFTLAHEAHHNLGLPIALATNGTIMDENIARRVVDAGFRRVSMSFDGPDAATHDRFRGIDGAFDSSTRGFKLLRSMGMSMQINTTISQHNYKKLDQMYRMALDLGADALHIFMLVPVGCGMELSEAVMLDPDEYENALNWIYDRSQEGRLHMKATCAPHYFRVMRERAKAEGQAMPKRNEGRGTKSDERGAKSESRIAAPHASDKNRPSPLAPRPSHPGGHPHAAGGGHPGASGGGDMSAMTKGCLAGQAICFVSHTGEVFPCGYLPVSSGNVKHLPLPTIWQSSPIFADMRDDSKLGGKCGVCEYKKVCMGCRARAYAETHDYLAEEPNCRYVPLRLRAAAT